MYTQQEIESFTTERLEDCIDNQFYTIFYGKQLGHDLEPAYALLGQYIYELDRRETGELI